jgi:citrate synthase
MEPTLRRTGGLENVVVTATRLSRVDGEAGQLVIGGLPVEELAPRACYEEVLFLLWHDRFPAGAELAELRAALAARRALPAGLAAMLAEAARAGADPMDALRLGVAWLAANDRELARVELQRETLAANLARAVALVAALPAMLAAFHRLSRGEPPVASDPALGHAADLLWMLEGRPPAPARTRALETYLATTVEHGMNASTFAARVVASTRADLAGAVAAALGALKGPLHGGAPGPALEWLLALREEAARDGRPLPAVAAAWAEETLRRGGRIMGFGHRVYRVRDPRAEVLSEAVAALAQDPAAAALLRDAQVVELAVLSTLERLKPGRRVQTNVEFYTALLLHALGLPPALFSPLFAVARVGGWTAHVLEQVAEDRLIRPQVAYRGVEARPWVPLEARAADLRH